MPVLTYFASRINKQVATYVSYYPDSQAVSIDVFTISWSFNLCYIFAPFSIMGQVLKKLQEDQGEAVVICPLWATQPWFPLFLGMIVEDSYNLPQTSKLLYLPQDPDRQHPLRKMRLGAFRLSGMPWHVQAYMDKQQILSLIPGGHLQQNSIGVISKSGCSFQIQDKLIHSTHL